MKKRTWAIAAFLMVIASPLAHGQPNTENKWHWIWVAPDYKKGWTTFEGDASVAMKGSRFEVTLDGVSADEQPSLKLVGTIVGKRVAATGIRLGTDASPEHYTGVIARGRTKRTDPSNGWGFDRIVLQAGPTFVGLYRDVRSTK
jgi:hypothetical protein